MNERIRELMRQACKESIRPESVLEDVPQDVLEKFAELIVRECAEIADVSEPFLATDLIKRHFGIGYE